MESLKQEIKTIIKKEEYKQLSDVRRELKSLLLEVDAKMKEIDRRVGDNMSSEPWKNSHKRF